jgi:NADPH-dependent 7-cyano-7-deazaguanine reductase QueF
VLDELVRLGIVSESARKAELTVEAFVPSKDDNALLKLTVYARYTRRGGLDIRPFRTSHPQALPGNICMARQ